jgi:hypothetical protein
MDRSFFRVAPYCALGAVAIAVAACSGAQPSDLFATDGGTPIVPDGSTTDAYVPPPADAGKDAPTPPPVDAGKDAMPPPPDAGPKTSPVACQNAGSCTAPGQVCCRTQVSFMNFTYACTTGAACMGNGTLALPCDDANDCAVLGAPGQVCCADLISAGQTLVASKLSCKPANQCTLQSMPAGVIVCDPKDPNACTGGQTCQQSSQTLPGYYICRN